MSSTLDTHTRAYKYETIWDKGTMLGEKFCVVERRIWLCKYILTKSICLNSICKIIITLLIFLVNIYQFPWKFVRVVCVDLNSKYQNKQKHSKRIYQNFDFLQLYEQLFLKFTWTRCSSMNKIILGVNLDVINVIGENVFYSNKKCSLKKGTSVSLTFIRNNMQKLIIYNIMYIIYIL